MSARHRRSRHTASDSSQAPPDRSERQGEDRLQKVLAAAGIASRRDCEELILAGRVEVDRKTVTELGTKVNAFEQEIRVDGVTLPQSKRIYFLLNKPAGVVCTNDDPSGRTRAVDLINTDQRIFPVGRLDRTSDGLLLLTNDGELANRLTHPRYGVPKTYLAVVAGHPAQATLDKLRNGVHLAEGFARAESVIFKRRRPKEAELIIVLKEGRNREIRRMLARVGHKVLRLRRTAIGPIKIGDLPVGAYRKLTLEELDLLQLASRRPPKSKQETAGERPVRSGRPRRERPTRTTRRPSRSPGPGERRPSASSRPRANQGARPKPFSNPGAGRKFAKPLIDERSKKTTHDRKSPAQGKVLGFDESDTFDE